MICHVTCRLKDTGCYPQCTAQCAGWDRAAVSPGTVVPPTQPTQPSACVGFLPETQGKTLVFN